MMFAWQKLKDARGYKRGCRSVFGAISTSGLSRRELVLPGHTTPFHHGFLIAGVLAVLIWLFIAKAFVPVLLDIEFWSPVGLAVYGFLFFFPGTICGLASMLNTWRSPQYAIDAMTYAGLCPSCAYRIDGIGPEPDGCTVCPECGGAWRIEG